MTTGVLAGKVAIVTGASKGIGRAIALAFAQEGAAVTVVGRDRERVEQTAAEIGGSGAEALGVVADVSDPADVHRVVGDTVGRFGRLDILVNNAGLAQGIAGRPIDSIVDVDVAVWDAIMAVNCRGPFLMMRESIPALAAAGGGSIINVTSRLGYRIVRGMIPYGPSKAALDHLSRLVAEEVRELGIRVNLIHPGGPVDTDIFTEHFRPGGDPSRVLPPEIAGPPAVWLASDASRSVTGETVDCRTWEASAEGR